MTNIFTNFFAKSPWDDLGNDNNENNIFTRPRKKAPFNFNDLNFDFGAKYILIGVGVFAFLWLSSGIYKVNEGEEAIVTRFGKFARKALPGLNYHLPIPFELVTIEDVNQSRRIEIGYRSSGTHQRSNNGARSMSTESTMLTGDENIVDLNADIMWHINDLEKFVFNIGSPVETVKSVSESAIREVIGNTPLSSILSNQKQEITAKIEKLIQSILDSYNAGVVIENVQLLKAEPPAEVIDAYRDVQTSKADKQRSINQAQAYSNDVVPRARGEAAKMLQEAEGYKQEAIARAEGDSKRFLAVYNQYVMNKQITKDRLYLETVEEILQGANKVIVGQKGMLPHMSIDPKPSN